MTNEQINEHFKTNCRWCSDGKGTHVKKYELEWTVIDEDFGQPVHINLIHFCPFCGRTLDDTDGGVRIV